MGAEVEFSIITSASSSQRTQMATMIQQDLKELGIRVQVVPLEFRAMLDRVLQTHNYEAAVMGLGGGDVDPNSQLNVWLSSGDDHLWDLGESQPATAWEAEMDRLMKQQMSTLAAKDRKRLYDRVQEIEVEDVPLVFLVSPNVLVGAKLRVHNFEPAILDSHTLWNAEQAISRRRMEKRGNEESTFIGRVEGELASLFDDDTRLVKECLRGEETAWSELVSKYKNLIFSIPIKYGFSQEEAADIFQSVCLDLVNATDEPTRAARSGRMVDSRYTQQVLPLHEGQAATRRAGRQSARTGNSG